MPKIRLGDGLVDVVLGQSPPSSTYNSSGRGLPFYQGKADFGLIHPTPRIWCTAGERFAQPLDVLVSVRAPVGDSNISTDHCVIGRGIAAIRAQRRLDPWFLYFALLSCKERLAAQATGSTFGSVNKNVLLDLELPCPARDEQQAIATVLRHVVRSVQRENVCSLATQALKRRLSSQLFANGLRGEPTTESSVGSMPVSWSPTSLGALGRVGNGSTPKKSVPAYWENGTHPWLTSAKVYDRDIIAADQFVTDVALLECHLPIIEPGAVLIAITGQGKTLGNCAVLRTRATISQHLAYVTLDTQRVDPGFIRGYLETQYENLRQVAAGGGSTKGALTCAYLRSVAIPLPATLDEQQEIVAILDAIDRKIDLHRRKRAVLDDLFKALLHKLMTGEIRVSDLDLPALESGPLATTAEA